jgi:hypothetical protein
MKIHYRDSVPFQKVSIDDFVPLLDDDDQYPIEFMENHSVIKLKEDEDAVFVGICDTNNLSLIENLRNFHKKRVV